MERQGIVKQIGDELSRVFRHLLPGVLILACARVAHPRWFPELQFEKPWQLAFFGVVALMVGNTWYVIHRYTVHELLNWIARGLRGDGWKGYPGWLAEHTYYGNIVPQEADRVREHLWLRSAQVIYLMIVGEVLMFFALQPAAGTVADRYSGWLLSGGIALVVLALPQYYLTARLDADAVNRWKKDGAA